jgi:nucleoside-diphosphate-sugar epimerase
VVAELRQHGFDVARTDVAATRDDVEAGIIRADLTDYEQASEVIQGTDAVVHLANVTSTYALSNVASETVAVHIADWSDIPFVALRISNIMLRETQ